MSLFIVIGSIIVVVLALVVWYDHRARRHGWRVGVSTAGARANRTEVLQASLGPIVQCAERD